VKQEVENADNFQSVRKATILFGFNQSKLTSEDTETLDSLAQTVSGMKHYVLEVRGFTDNVGPKPYNLALSRRRADAVVRYLTLDKQIPLVRVYVAGYGEENPAAPNNTHDGREQNRRVDVSILAPQSAGPAAGAKGLGPESQKQESASGPQQ
jgi:outer membrane protein OmpA-like peptidoglycan-associated protein